MVRKAGRDEAAARRRPGRRSAAAWARWREAFEDGVALEDIAAAAGLRPATLAARAAAEDWLSPRRAVIALGRALEAEIAGVEGALSLSGGLADPDKRVRALEGLSRAAERLTALRAAQRRAGAPAGEMARPVGGEDGVDEAHDEAAALPALRLELERRLDRCAAALGAAAVPRGSEPVGPEGAGDDPEA